MFNSKSELLFVKVVLLSTGFVGLVVVMFYFVYMVSIGVQPSEHEMLDSSKRIADYETMCYANVSGLAIGIGLEFARLFIIYFEHFCGTVTFAVINSLCAILCVLGGQFLTASVGAITGGLMLYFAYLIVLKTPEPQNQLSHV